MIKAHPILRGVLSTFEKHIESAEPDKKKRPKMRLQVKDTVTPGFQGVSTFEKHNPNEPSRLISISLEVEKGNYNVLLIRQSAKAHPNLGTFREDDYEGERDVALFVEGLVGRVITDMATAGLLAATSNAFYEQQ